MPLASSAPYHRFLGVLPIAWRTMTLPAALVPSRFRQIQQVRHRGTWIARLRKPGFSLRHSIRRPRYNVLAETYNLTAGTGVIRSWQTLITACENERGRLLKGGKNAWTRRGRTCRRENRRTPDGRDANAERDRHQLQDDVRGANAAVARCATCGRLPHGGLVRNRHREGPRLLVFRSPYSRGKGQAKLCRSPHRLGNHGAGEGSQGDQGQHA